MKTTKNYQLNQPEKTDFVNIEEINANMEKVDAVLKALDEGKADASGGDISDTVIKTGADIKTDYPVPAAGDTTETFLGKMKKFCTDIKNWMTGVCLLGQIVNNCVTDNPGLPLSAAQGKVLMDLYTVLNTKAVKRNESNNIDGQLVCTKYSGINASSYNNSPLVIKAPYAVTKTARAQLSFENEGLNAATLWLGNDGTLKYILNTGQAYKLLAESTKID